MDDKKRFTVKLFQSHWQRSHTETFEIEAKDQTDAKTQADEIAKDKGLKKDFDFEFEEIELPEAEPVEEAAADTILEDPKEVQEEEEQVVTMFIYDDIKYKKIMKRGETLFFGNDEPIPRDMFIKVDEAYRAQNGE